MWVRRLSIGVVAASISCAVAAGCAAAGGDGVEETNTAAVEDISVGSGDRSDAADDSIPDRVTVTQPALIDTDARPADLPVWPGPDPSEFLAPSPPSGTVGQLTGAQAEQVFVAAQANPGEFWNVGGVVLWLVVEAIY